MKTRIALIIALLAFSLGIVSAVPLGTAFTYQGRLADGGSPANGNYDLRFAIYDALADGNAVGGPLTNAAVTVSNGLFTVALDFGSGVFTGDARWLEIGVRSNGVAADFTALSPRQPLTPAPYAIMANSASNLLGALPAAQLSGTVGNDQLANSSITVNAGAGLGGGGTLPLGGTTTLSNTGVLSVTGNADIIASPTAGSVGLSTTATTANTPGTIVKRDGSGNFAAGSVNLAGNLNLPNQGYSGFGVIYSGTNRLIHNPGNENFFAGAGAGGIYAAAGNCSVGIGYKALSQTSSGGYNTATGASALENNTIGNYNTANGYLALHQNKNGNDNTANGAEALSRNTNGGFNTANGSSALAYNASGDFNTANGHWALRNQISGDRNTANGAYALVNNINGSNNIALGYYAASFITNNNNIDIGNQGDASDNGVIRIGTSGTHGNTFIAGIYGGTPVDSAPVFVNAAGQLGTAGTVPPSQLPAEVLTNNQSGVTLSGTFSGSGAGLTNLPGVLTWQQFAESSVQAQPNNGYIANANNAQKTVTLPTAPSLGDTVRVSGPGAGGWKITQNPGQSILGGSAILSPDPANWTPHGPVEAWKAVASSADGTKLVACVNGGQIYTSVDGGVSWASRDSSRNWRCVASSADGTKLVACVAGGQIYTSTDSGVNWTARDSNRFWNGVASSADGTVLLASDEGLILGDPYIYTSTDSGVNWTARDISRTWSGVASSSRGNYLVACVRGGHFYRSVNWGETWYVVRGSNIRNWCAVASSADGTKLVACEYGGSIWTSADAGFTWSASAFPLNQNWSGVASSADGSKLVACVSSGRIYTSTDSGVNWTTRESLRLWSGVASSADGSRLFACGADILGGNNHIYISEPALLGPGSTTTVGTAGYLTGGQGTAIELLYVGDNQFFPLSHEGAILGY